MWPARAAGRIRGRRRPRGRIADAGPVSGERGLSSIEVVLLAPVIILFILLLVALGQQVSGRAAVDGAARDAARAGSLERGAEAALAASERVARGQLAGTCVDGSVRVENVGGPHEPDTLYVIRVQCKVRGLDLLGLPVTSELTARSSSPIDPYRRAG